MFWRMAGLSTTSPVESLLDRDGFTLEELLDEDELIQECKSLNTRLINFLRGKVQIQQLLKYIIEEPPEGADNKRAFKFPFIACEIFTCEIEVIIKTTVEDEELMGLLFSFLESDRLHGTLLAGYFSKVVICLLLRKTAAVMHYLQAHQEILKKLVDLIGITSIMEVLIRLVGADDNMHTFNEDSSHWLANTDLLEMLVDKLTPPNSSEARANAADTLSAVSILSQSELATKLSSPSFITKLFHHALEDEDSKSTLVHTLTVCISLLDPKKYMIMGTGRGQHRLLDVRTTATPETIDGMLQRLGGLLKLLNVGEDERVLPTTYGQLRPPLGTHRLKIVEFLAVLLRTKSEAACEELVKLGAIQLVLNLFFDYPFNNLLHHHATSIVVSCIESNDKMLIDHLLVDCDLVSRLLEADENPSVSSNGKPTVPASGKTPPRIGNLGHLTRIANRLVHAADANPDIQAHLEGNPNWVEWQSGVLQSRNAMEDVYQWTCGRPTTVRDCPVDSDEYDFRDKDYDISGMTSNLTHEVYRYGMFDNEDGDEGLGMPEREDDDVFFDDESAEVVISSLRLGEEQNRSKDSFLSGPNGFAFQDDRPNQWLGSFLGSNPVSRFDEVQGNASSSSNSSSSDDEVVVGEDEDMADTASSSENAAYFSAGPAGDSPSSVSPDVDEAMIVASEGGTVGNPVDGLTSGIEKLDVSSSFLSEDLFSVRSLDDWASWKEPPPAAVPEGTSRRMSYDDDDTETHFGAWEAASSGPSMGVELEGQEGMERADVWKEGMEGAEVLPTHVESIPAHTHADTTQVSVPLFEGGAQVVGVEMEGTAKAMEHALREGIVGEAAPIHPLKETSHDGGHESKTEGDSAKDLDFTDVNYWRSDYNQSIPEVKSL